MDEAEVKELVEKLNKDKENSTPSGLGKPIRVGEEPPPSMPRRYPRRGIADVGITSRSFFGRRSLLGVGSRGIFSHDRRPIIGQKPILDIGKRGIFDYPHTPIIGVGPPAVSTGPAITNTPILGKRAEREIGNRVFGRRR